MYCPECASEFREGITYCANCEVDLVAERPGADPFISSENMAERLSDSDLEAAVVGTYAAVESAQRFLAGERIPSLVAPDEDAELQAGIHSRLFLMVAKEDVDRVRALFEARFASGVSTEGLMLKRPETIEADAEGALPCPACDTPVPADVEECPECGLCLGGADFGPGLDDEEVDP